MPKLIDNNPASKLPIGDQGVRDYVDQMNRDHPNAPYIWRVGTRTNPDGQTVRCVEAIRKSELRNAGPRVTPAEMQEILGRTRYLDAAE